MPTFKYSLVEVSDPDQPLDDEHRAQLLDGLPSYRTGELNMCIAFARSLLTVLLYAGVLLLVRLVFSADVSEDVVRFEPTLVMDCSSGSAMLCPEHEADSEQFWKVLNNSRTKSLWLRFNLSTGSMVTFYKNEEVYHCSPSLWRALSLGLMPQSPLQFNIDVDSASAFCVPDERRELDEKYGLAIFASLARAGHKKVMYATSGDPVSFNGGMLIRDDFARFLPREGHFERSGSGWIFLLLPWASTGWKFFIILVYIAVALLTCLGFADLAMRCFRAWNHAVNDWIVQYDYLWHAKDLQQRPNKTSRTIDEWTGAKESNNDCLQVAADQISRLTFCSPYFIADATLGDVWKVSASWCESLKGTALAWLMLLAPTIALIPFGLFHPWPRIYIFYGLTIYWTSAAVLGILYAFSVSQCIRRPFIFFLILLNAIFSIISTMYAVMLALFLLLRLVTEPQQVIGLAAPVLSIIVYVFVAVKQFSDLHTHFKSQHAGKLKKGMVYLAMDEFGLSEKWLLLTVIGTVLMLLLLVLILSLGSIMWTENVDAAGKNPIPAVVVPVTTYIQYVNQVQGMKQKTQADVGQVTNVVSSIL